MGLFWGQRMKNEYINTLFTDDSVFNCKHSLFYINSLRPSDAYVRQQTNRHWFR